MEVRSQIAQRATLGQYLWNASSDNLLRFYLSYLVDLADDDAPRVSGWTVEQVQNRLRIMIPRMSG